MIGLCTNRKATAEPINTASDSAISVTRSVTHSARISTGVSDTKTDAIWLGAGNRYDGMEKARQPASHLAITSTPTISGGAMSAILLRADAVLVVIVCFVLSPRSFRGGPKGRTRNPVTGVQRASGFRVGWP